MPSDALSPLQRLSALGQSVWVDFLSRDSIRGGHLQELIDELLRRRRHVEPDDLPEGDDRGRRLRRADPRAGNAGQRRVGDASGRSPSRTSTTRVTCSVRCGTRSGGRDGYVSLEVDPRLAYDTLETFREAMRLHETVDRAEPDGEDPRHQARARGDRGRDRQGPLDQRHADLLAAAATRRSPSPTSAASSGSSPRAATRARSPRWRASSSRGSTPRPTAAWRRSAARIS